MGGKGLCGLPTSSILLQYQQNTKGIDVVDQYRHYYTAMLQSHKWWHKLLNFVIDSSLLNAFILYRADATSLGLAVFSCQLWYYTLDQALVAPFVGVNVPRGPTRNLGRRGFHDTERHPDVRRRCRICGSRTRIFCANCGGHDLLHVRDRLLRTRSYSTGVCFETDRMKEAVAGDSHWWQSMNPLSLL